MQHIKRSTKSRRTLCGIKAFATDLIAGSARMNALEGKVRLCADCDEIYWAGE